MKKKNPRILLGGFDMRIQEQHSYYYIILLVLLSGSLISCLGQEGTTSSRKAFAGNKIKGSITVKGFYLGMSSDECVNILNGNLRDIFLPEGGILKVAIIKMNGQWYRHEVGNSWRGKIDTLCLSLDTSDYNYNQVLGYKPSIKTSRVIDNVFFDEHSQPCPQKIFCWDDFFFIPEKHQISSCEYFSFDANNKLIKIEFPESIVNNLFNVGDMTVQSFLEAFIKNYKIPEMKPINDSYWGYTSPTGWKVQVFPNKSLRIMSVPKITERKFD
jgi:hypothetical protein